MNKIAIAQTTSSGNWRQNIEKAKQFIKDAKKENACLIVFPEYFMNYYPDEDHKYVRKAQTLNGDFVQEMRQLAKKYGMWILFGMNEWTIDETKNYNTIVVLDDKGEHRSDYRKTHLFNAYNWQESKDTLAGNRFFDPVKSPAGKIGLGICYDLRFPEVARYEALAGAEIMIYPSAWVKGEGKFMQWETLLRARAIENEMYVLGCCHYSDKHYMGKSTGFGPDGKRLYLGEAKEQLLFAQIDLEQIKMIRKANPIFKNRQEVLYGREKYC